MAGFISPFKVRHNVLGLCELVRSEGLDLIVRPDGGVVEYRFPPHRKHELAVVREPEPITTPDSVSIPPTVTVAEAAGSSTALVDRQEQTLTSDRPCTSASPAKSAESSRDPLVNIVSGVLDRSIDGRASTDTAPRMLRRILRSLRNGLPPTHASMRHFAVGAGGLITNIQQFLNSIESAGGAALNIRGSYGHGKTFSLTMLEQMAVEAGFVASRIEIDATENRLDKPHNIYRQVLANLRIPGGGSDGARGVISRVSEEIKDVSAAYDVLPQTRQRKAWLSERLGCRPLAWLFSDPNFKDKEELIGLFTGSPVRTTASARREHILRGGASEWPTFSYGTQGDVASYLLSGIGRLCILLGFKGLVLILDEMERWQDLDWNAQTRAGNLLGGLIWAATSPEHKRRCLTWERDQVNYLGSRYCDHTDVLVHSGWNRGYPFTTRERCHLGIALAMTPRGPDGPEHQWQQYGELATVDLPEFNEYSLAEFYERIVPWFRRAYELVPAIPNEVFGAALNAWRGQTLQSARSGVTTVLDALYSWLAKNGSGGFDGGD